MRYYARAIENFSGDLVMAAPVSSSKVRLFLGDCSGHGLSAAVCAMPISDVFYAMAARALPLVGLGGGLALGLMPIGVVGALRRRKQPS